MSGEWPPDWEEPDEVFPDQAEQLDEDTGARLSEVSAFLATVPAPLLPDSVAARISAAIAAEAAARAAESGRPVENPSPVENPPAVDNQATDGRLVTGDNAQPVDNGRTARGQVSARTLGRAPERARVRRRIDPRKFLVAAPVLVVCLLFAGLVYAISHAPSSSSSSAASGSAAAPVAPVPAGSASGTAAGGERSAASEAEPPPFTVTDSGTRYKQGTLAEQVLGVLGSAPASGTTRPGPASSSAAGSSGSSARYPSPQLVGCVRLLTGGSPPKLVDQGTYQGTPAYVIASSKLVWVVGLGCSATDPELVTTVPLAG